MISITHADNDILVLISGKDEQDMTRLIDDTKRRYPEYCLQYKEEPARCWDGRYVVVLVPTVELF